MVSYGSTARHKAGIDDVNHTRIKQVADNFHSVIMIRCVSPDNASLNHANYETKGFHIKAKSCNFGPMREFICSDPLLSKQAFKADGWKKQKKYLKLAKDDGAEEIGLTLQWRRIKELRDDLHVISEDKISPIPKQLKKSANNPNRHTIACKATFKLSPGKPQLDPKVRDIKDYVYFLSTDAKDPEALDALYKVYYVPNFLLPNHAERLMVLANPTVMRDYKTQQSIVGLEDDSTLLGRDFQESTDYLRAVIADYDLFGVWTNFEDDYESHYLHSLRFDQYLLRFRRCVPGRDAIYNLRNIDSFVKFEDTEMGNLSANLTKIIRAINGSDKVDGRSNQNYTDQTDANADHRRRKFLHHSDETGRPCLDAVDLPIYIVVPDKYSDLANYHTEVFIDKIDEFVDFAARFCSRDDFLVEFNPGWEGDLKTKLAAKDITFSNFLPIPGAVNNSETFGRDNRLGVDRIRRIVSNDYVGHRLPDSRTQIAQPLYTQNNNYYGPNKTPRLAELRKGTLQPD
ncbi:anthrax toxin-like adenylyl cyclase domain-containing protein [Pseudobacteriovorax antillogorgiicola]|uniref:Toxin LF subunit n=1 Tax=Pseudobacteriovorax antillogorgiicola TaxID=1513793 RepID=A0A1Y6BBH8_9BACT|nr:anthrax toxin-like adenylyl cyclase domain-containing protein [Pseudobacteriovorax antillogorgiicola]TCS58781.1 toxin LF subunit [Pseudobacteriovorax antillogorgiicola]SME94784.1 toxin LF subunit [Pseudobacteriovorax antillogorgiicola]